jgi:hypothetical protein
MNFFPQTYCGKNATVQPDDWGMVRYALVILRAIQHRGNDQMHGPDHGDPKVAVQRH